MRALLGIPLGLVLAAAPALAGGSGVVVHREGMVATAQHVDSIGAVVAIAAGRLKSGEGEPSAEAYGVSVLSLWNYLAFQGLEATPAGAVTVGDDELARLAAATVLPVSCGS